MALYRASMLMVMDSSSDVTEMLPFYVLGTTKSIGRISVALMLFLSCNVVIAAEMLRRYSARLLGISKLRRCLSVESTLFHC
jgi:hypothetical protein